MNQSIRCEPLPFPTVSEKAAGEATLSPNEENVEFGEVLDAELSDSKQTRENGRKKDESDPSEALAAYGVVMPTVIQILRQEVTIDSGGETSAEEGQGSNPLPAEAATETPASTDEPKSEPEQPATAGASRAEIARAEIVSRLKRLELSEQKLPSATRELSFRMAQIARNTVEPAKIASGMVAAQRPPMLLANSNQEEKSSREDVKHSVEVKRFEASTFEKPIRVVAVSRESAPKTDIDLAEMGALDATASELPTFEGVSEGQDIQPARPVEATVLTEAIRTHVQLLKSSAQDRLDVVLRPDAHTELHLRVETVNGKIQVQARCDRGDFALLEANWNTVQSTLAHQGIRVEPLQTSGGTHFQNQPQNPQQGFGEQSSQRQEREKISLEQEIPIRKATRPQAANGAAVRGWQSWA